VIDLNAVSSESFNSETGSLNQGEPVYIAIAKIGKPHGLQGEFFIHLLTDFPERIKKGRTVFLGKHYQKVIIKSVRAHNKGLLIHLEGIDDINDVEKIKSQYVYVLAESLPPLPEGEYYHHQLLGLKVFDDKNNYLGELSEILVTGANDVYVVKNESKEELIPALKQNLILVDIQNQRMVVKPLEYYNQD